MGSPHYTATITALVTVKFRPESDMETSSAAIEAFESAMGVDIEDTQILSVTDIEKESY